MLLVGQKRSLSCAGLAEDAASAFGRAAADAFAEKLGQRNQKLVAAVTEAIKALLRPDCISMSSAASPLAGRVCPSARQHYASPMRPAIS